MGRGEEIEFWQGKLWAADKELEEEEREVIDGQAAPLWARISSSFFLFLFFPLFQAAAGGTVSTQSPTAADRAEGWKEDRDGPQIKDKAGQKESAAEWDAARWIAQMAEAGEERRRGSKVAAKKKRFRSESWWELWRNVPEK